MRNAGVAKMGFYPTPEESLERILDLLAPLSGGLFGKAALDPCAGEGEALRRACERLGLRPHAIELDEERAKRAKKALAPLGGRSSRGTPSPTRRGGSPSCGSTPRTTGARRGGSRRSG